MKRKRSWSAPDEPLQTVGKLGLHPKKAMLCIWWDCKGPIFYELLKMNETINTERYCKQLDNLKAAIQEYRLSITNRHEVVFHQDIASSNVSVKSLQKLKGFDWDVLNHHRTPQTWRLQTFTYSVATKIPSWKKINFSGRCPKQSGQVLRSKIRGNLQKGN